MDTQRRYRRNKVVELTVVLTIGGGLPGQREWRAVHARVREAWDMPTVLYGVLDGAVAKDPLDPRLAALIAQRPPRPANQRAGGGGLLKAYWEELRQAANATPGLKGRWGDWKALRRYVERWERRVRKDQEALEEFDTMWSRIIEARDTALVVSEP